MSKQNNLTDFLVDVANAIRTKKGTSLPINPQNFSDEIATLPTGLEVIEMTETTATIEPNKVYVWGMVESLGITLGASTGENDFFAFRFRCSKPTMTSVTVNGATWADDTELDETGKPVLDLGSWYQCEIKGGTSALYARLAHYIPFADSNVEAVLFAKGVGDGLGVTYKDAATLASISTWFKGNADITAFSEFVNFSGISRLLDYAFQNCSSLAEIALPDTLTSIGRNIFQNCSLLTRVMNLENTKVTDIGGSAFKDCISLAEIALPASLTSIGGNIFQGCKSLTRVMNLENTKVTGIGAYAFYGCKSLTEISLPASLTNIRDNAFNDCKSLTRVMNLENTKVTDIGGSAFKNCTLLTEITLPDTLTSIGGSAFQGWSSLTRVINFENTKVTGIGAYAFYACSALTEITLPDTLTSIRDNAFNDCKSLQYIRIQATTPPTLSNTNAIPSTIGAIYVPDESVAAYQAATNWSSFASKIKGISEMPAK